jgi:hypothetical protein
MKKLASILLITAVAALGCGEESEPGGPGATPTGGANGANGNGGQVQNEENTFTMTVPSGATNIEPGGSQAVTLEISRGDQFQEEVTLTFSAPQGITVNPQEATIPANLEETEVTLTAEQTVQPGTHEIQVTATPASGQNPVTKPFKVEIEAADGGDRPQGGRQPAGQQPRGQQPGGQQPADQPPLEPAPTQP